MKALKKDVTYRFSLPILPTTVKRIKGAMAQPLGMAEQLSLSETGKRVPKYRLTQDLSFSLTDGKLSVNARIDMDAYVEMIYGWCLPRIVHYTVALRQKYPTKRIFFSKYDYSDAYRRISHSASAASHPIHCTVWRASVYRPSPNVWRVTQPSDMVHVLRDCHQPGKRNPPL
jgi:hypothetical protein